VEITTEIQLKKTPPHENLSFLLSARAIEFLQPKDCLKTSAVSN
jgi:hypothetical protein